MAAELDMVLLDALGVLDAGMHTFEVYPDEKSWILLPMGEVPDGPTCVRIAFGEEEKLGHFLAAAFTKLGHDLTPKGLPPPVETGVGEYDGTPCKEHQWITHDDAEVRVCVRCSTEEPSSANVIAPEPSP